MSDPVHIGNVVRHARIFNFRKYGDNPMNTDTFLQAVSRLFRLLHEREIDYLRQADLRNADLRLAELEGTDFSYATWTDGSRCAQGSIGECRPEKS
jgi:uncharacterized protein YjbI with pentapeptide repeats